MQAWDRNDVQCFSKLCFCTPESEPMKSIFTMVMAKLLAKFQTDSCIVISLWNRNYTSASEYIWGSIRVGHQRWGSERHRNYTFSEDPKANISKVFFESWMENHLLQNHLEFYEKFTFPGIQLTFLLQAINGNLRSQVQLRQESSWGIRPRNSWVVQVCVKLSNCIWFISV